MAGKNLAEKVVPVAGKTAALIELPSKIHLKISWASKQSQRNKSYMNPKSIAFLMWSHSSTKNLVEVGKGKKRRKSVAQWPKVLFSDKKEVCISFGSQCPRLLVLVHSVFEVYRHLPEHFMLPSADKLSISTKMRIYIIIQRRDEEPKLLTDECWKILL